MRGTAACQKICEILKAVTRAELELNEIFTGAI